MGPGLTETHNTPELLVKAGIEYTTDWVLDDQPTVIKTKVGPLFSIPYSVEVNDVVLMAVERRPSSELYDRAMITCERYLSEGRSEQARRAGACVPSLPVPACRTASGTSRNVWTIFPCKEWRDVLSTGGKIIPFRYKSQRGL